jgi:hypothetical protein
MSENSVDGIDFGSGSTELEFGGEKPGEEGFVNAAESIPTDFGKDMAWTGESVWDTTKSVGEELGSDVSSHAESLVDDIAGGHPIKATEDLIGGVWDTGVDLVEGAGAEAFDVAAGGFAAASAVGIDTWNTLAEGVDAVGDGIEDVAEDIGDGVEDLADDIEDLF